MHKSTMHIALMDSDDALGRRLREAREAKGLEPHEAARRMAIAYPTLMNHEKGHRGARRRASDYARLYGVNLVWLANGVGPMKGADPLLAAISEMAPTERKQVEDFIDFIRRKRSA